MLKRYGIHGLTGIGGISPIFGVSAPSAGGCTFELLARFDVANQAYANGQVLIPATGCDIGQFTVVDTGAGSAQCLANQLRLIGGGNWDETGIHAPAVVKALGKGLLFNVEFASIAVNSRTYGGWNGQPGLTVANYNIINFLSGNLYASTPPVGSTLLGTYAAATAYEVALVLGGYDINGVPWDDSQPVASYLYGVAWFIRGGTWATWTLVWRTVFVNTTPVYPFYQIRDAFNADSDNFRVSNADYSTTLQPIIKDIFTGNPGDPLANHIPDVSPTGGTWTVYAGGWDIPGLVRTVNPVPGGPIYSIAAVESNISDIWARMTLATNCVAARTGLLFRLSDGTNFWVAVIIQGTNVFRIEECNGGVVNVRASVGFAVATFTDYEATVIAEGNNISAWIDGANLLTWASAFNNGATQHGTQGEALGCTRNDDFHVQEYSGYTQLDECP